MQFRPIGLLRTPFDQPAAMPIQPSAARGTAGRIELDPELAEGLRDLAGFSHIIVLYYFHRTSGVRLTVTPFLDEHPRGLFATRAPCRPNPIGLSVLRLVGVEGNLLAVEDVDMLDGSPLLDIKPYVPRFDQPAGPVRSGWVTATDDQLAAARSDNRFTQPDSGRQEE